MFTTKRTFIDKIEVDLPEDIQVLSCHELPTMNCMGIVVQSASFGIVPEGTTLPIINPVYTRFECQANLLELVSRQAEDEGLWFEAQTAPEAYLQQELRKLHEAIERKP